MGILHTPYLTFRFNCQESTKKTAQNLHFLVTKAQVKRAVDRNLIKRRARAAVHSLKDKISPNCSGTFSFKKSSLEITFKVFEQEIINTIRRAKIIE